jgi:hypothetical protein
VTNHKWLNWAGISNATVTAERQQISDPYRTCAQERGAGGVFELADLAGEDGMPDVGLAGCPGVLGQCQELGDPVAQALGGLRDLDFGSGPGQQVDDGFLARGPRDHPGEEGEQRG